MTKLIMAIGVSDTVPTVVFNPREILRCDDARADSAQAWRTNLKRSDEKKRHYNTSVSEVAVMNDVSACVHSF